MTVDLGDCAVCLDLSEKPVEGSIPAPNSDGRSRQWHPLRKVERTALIEMPGVGADATGTIIAAKIVRGYGFPSSVDQSVADQGCLLCLQPWLTQRPILKSSNDSMLSANLLYFRVGTAYPCKRSQRTGRI
ncbi:MAG: hypothetical protein ACJA1E_001795 [Paracoccaceae bacterium]|jgi:hypothetical protein